MLTTRSANPSPGEIRVRGIRSWWDSSARDAHAVAAALRLLAVEYEEEAPTVASLLNDLAEHVPSATSDRG